MLRLYINANYAFSYCGVTQVAPLSILPLPSFDHLHGCFTWMDGRELTALYLPASLLLDLSYAPSVRKKSIPWWWGGVVWGASPTLRYASTFFKSLLPLGILTLFPKLTPILQKVRVWLYIPRFFQKH